MRPSTYSHIQIMTNCIANLIFWQAPGPAATVPEPQKVKGSASNIKSQTSKYNYKVHTETGLWTVRSSFNSRMASFIYLFIFLAQKAKISGLLIMQQYDLGI